MALAQEFRFAARMLARNKGWTIIAVLALALGLGANIAIYSVVGLMLWTPLPYPHPEQLVYIPQTNLQQGFSQAAVSLRDTRDWASASSIASIAAYQSRPVAISGQGEPQHLPAMQVSPEFFPTLGVMPVLGRAFTAAESPETESRVAIISHELWQGMYRGDPARPGPRHPPGRPQLFHRRRDAGRLSVPLSAHGCLDSSLARARASGNAASRGLNNVARLKPGVHCRPGRRPSPLDLRAHRTRGSQVRPGLARRRASAGRPVSSTAARVPPRARCSAPWAWSC